VRKTWRLLFWVQGKVFIFLSLVGPEWSVSGPLGCCSALLQGMAERSGQGLPSGRVDGQIVFLLQQGSSLQEGEKVEGGCYCSVLWFKTT